MLRRSWGASLVAIVVVGGAQWLCFAVMRSRLLLDVHDGAFEMLRCDWRIGLAGTCQHVCVDFNITWPGSSRAPPKTTSPG